MTLALCTKLHTSFQEAVEQTTQALADQGFGVLTKIDVKTTLKQKLGQDMEDYLILGACNPSLAHRALDVDRQIGQLLPCNVVVRADVASQGDTVIVEAMDPQIMVRVADQRGLQEIADKAAAKLHAAISALGQTAQAR
ncbi:ABC transporter [Mycobacterium interjectum]|nr:ABC transporter [Mycobacterium interjectum]